MTQRLNNFKSWNPHEIKVPTFLGIDKTEVAKVISSFQADGIIPDIIISESGELIEGIHALEAAKSLDQEMVMVTVQPPIIEVPPPLFTTISAELLYVHPLNASIYGENEDLQFLKEAIASTGWIKPLIVTLDKFLNGNERYRIVSGNSCFKVGCELGRKEFFVELKIFNSEQEELKTLLAGNVGREKTIEQKVREGLLWEKIEREESTLRSKAGKKVDPVKNFSQGKTRDNIAKRVGLGSGVNYEHAVAAVREMDNSIDAPVGSVQHHRHQQFKQLLSRTRGVDAAYKLVKPAVSPSLDIQQRSLKKSLHLGEAQDRVFRWIPKLLERVKIIGGPHKGKLATVRVVLSLEVMAHIDGAPENKRDNIAFRHLEPNTEEKTFTSVAQETAAKQKEMGFGRGRSQLLPDLARNVGSPVEQQPALITNLNVIGDVLVTEVAIALLKLTPKQLHEVMCKVEPELTSAHLEAIWKALEKSLSHKAA
ncbi:MAG: hypothetical protein V7K21_19285 [Nostoc sp.]|uniref:hypothetical protein n=1 Tax=Nostoc sp. TaxID=1180 RepID=UPI002FF7BF42